MKTTRIRTSTWWSPSKKRMPPITRILALAPTNSLIERNPLMTSPFEASHPKKSRSQPSQRKPLHQRPMARMDMASKMAAGSKVKGYPRWYRRNAHIRKTRRMSQSSKRRRRRRQPRTRTMTSSSSTTPRGVPSSSSMTETAPECRGGIITHSRRYDDRAAADARQARISGARLSYSPLKQHLTRHPG